MKSDWQIQTLADLCLDVSYGYTESAQTVPVGPRFLRITDIQNGVVDWLSVPYCTIESRRLQNYLLQRGDIVVARTGNSTGENYIFDSSEQAVFASYLIRFRIDHSKANPWFVWYQLRTQRWWDFVAGSKTGSAQAGANAQVLGRFEIVLASRHEQDGIVERLRRIDRKIAVNLSINRTLEAMAQAIFKSWFVDFDPVKAKIAAKAEGRDPLRAAMSAISGKTDAELDALPPEQHAQVAATAALFPDEMADSASEDIPKGWNVGSFKDCCLRVESGGTPSRKEPTFWNGSIPWLTSGEVREVMVLDTKEKITRAGLDSSSAKLWPPMTSVVAMYGATAGQVCLIAEEMTANQACCALVPKSEFTAFIFIAARQSIQQLAEKASGSAQQNLNKSLVENHACVIPYVGVAQKFEMATTPLLQKWAMNQREANTLGNVRDTLLPKLLSGELSVTAREIEALA